MAERSVLGYMAPSTLQNWPLVIRKHTGAILKKTTLKPTHLGCSFKELGELKFPFVDLERKNKQTNEAIRASATPFPSTSGNREENKPCLNAPKPVRHFFRV